MSEFLELIGHCFGVWKVDLGLREFQTKILPKREFLYHNRKNQRKHIQEY